jgi:hypothetical protein
VETLKVSTPAPTPQCLQKNAIKYIQKIALVQHKATRRRDVYYTRCDTASRHPDISSREETTMMNFTTFAPLSSPPTVAAVDQAGSNAKVVAI